MVKWNKYDYFDTYKIEKHPFNQFIEADTKYLIIGTFPTNLRNVDYKFFYGGKDNSFWNIMEIVYKHTFKHHNGNEAVNERKEFLSSRKIGMTDMLEKCYRKNGLSGDEHLFIIKLNDIFSILRKYETIETIILTSRTKVIGALGLLNTYFIQNDRELREPEKFDNILISNFEFEGRQIEVLVPYSPSPRVIGEDNINLKKVAEMYRYCLSEN